MSIVLRVLPTVVIVLHIWLATIAIVGFIEVWK